MSTNNLVKWSALDAVVTACPSAAMKNLGIGNHALGPELDNSAGSQYAYPLLYVRGAAAFSAADVVSVWFLKALDGVNYEDGAAGTPGTSPARPADLVIPVRTVSTQQRAPACGNVPVLLPACKFKTLVQNTTHQAFSNTEDENVLAFYGVNDNIVVP